MGEPAVVPAEVMVFRYRQVAEWVKFCRRATGTVYYSIPFFEGVQLHTVGLVMCPCGVVHFTKEQSEAIRDFGISLVWRFPR